MSARLELGCFLQLDPALGAADAAPEGPLAGIPFAVKDNIAVRGFHLTCGSRMLRDFITPYTATAVERLQKAGAVVVGKTNLDEFGMGSSTENSALMETRNPWDRRSGCREDRAAVRRWRWPPASSPLPWEAIPEARCASRPPSAVSTA